MGYTYDDFVKAAGSAGLMGNFSQQDLDMARKSPEYGLSMLKIFQDEQSATTAEQRLLAQEAANQLRGSYSAGAAIPAGTGEGSFRYGREEEYRTLLDNIVNRGEFSYDHQEDPRWGALKKSYTREGERATADALAQAAAATGGVPSSYALTAATQAGDYYAGQLADRIPELYDDAYSRYLQDFGLDLEALGALEQDKAFDYNAFLQKIEQERQDAQIQYDREQQGTQLEYDKEQQKLANALAIYQATGQMTPEMAELFGLTELLTGTAGDAGAAGGAVTGDASGGYGAGNGTLTPEQVVQLQIALGVEPDGIYGPLSQEAADGLSAEDAYAKHVGGGQDSGGLDDTVKAELQSKYPTGIVPDRNAWNKLVKQYGADALAQTGMRYEKQEDWLWNATENGKIIVSGKAYSPDEISQMLANGTMRAEAEPGTGKIRYYIGRPGINSPGR